MTADEKTKNKKVYGSSSAFMQGTLVFTETPSGCLRNTLLQHHGVRDQIDQIHIVRGAINEENYEKKLQAQNTTYEREVPVRSVVAGFPSVTFSGRCDFIILDEQGNRRVIELKSTESKSRLKDIKSGFYKIYNLAQLIAYMIETRTTTGELVYTYYEKDDNDAYKPVYENSLKVVVDEHGSIMVNNLPSGFTVHDQLLHRVNSAKVITEGIIWSRPHKWDVAWKSPCNLCTFKTACNKVDSGEIEGTDAFIEAAKKLVTKESDDDSSGNAKV